MNNTEKAPRGLDSQLSTPENSEIKKSSESVVIVFVIVAIISTLTTWALGLIEIGSDESTPIGFTNGFPGDTENWGRKGDWESMAFSDDAIFIQRKNEQQSSAYRTFKFPETENIHEYRLQVEGAIENQTIDLGFEIETLENPMAALMVWVHGADDEILQYRTIQDLDQAVLSYEAKRSVSLPEGSQAVSIVLATRGSVAGFMLLDASMQLIKESSASFYVKSFIGVLWLILLLLALFWTVMRTSLTFAFAVLAVCLAIGVGIVLPDSVSSRLLLPLQLKLSSLGGGFENNWMETLFKSGHFFFFLVASFVLFLKRRALGISSLLLLVLLLTLALATEGFQLQLYDRTTRLTDLIIDLSGVAAGALFAILLRIWKPEPIVVRKSLDTD